MNEHHAPRRARARGLLAAVALACAGATLTLPLTAVLAPTAAIAAPLPALGATPGWVAPVEPDTGKEVKNAINGVDYLLADMQTRVAPDGSRHAFRHYAMKVRTAKGLDHTGQIEIEWDPAYQRLQLHTLRVLRNGRWLPWQDRASARTIDREPEAEQRIYDGRKTMVLQLDDIRVGDVLEYAYTVTGWNPVYGGKQFGGFPLDFGAPVARIHNRLLLPARREVTVTSSPGAPEPRMTTIGDQVERVWDLADVVAVHREKDTPSWFDPWGEVRWTEFRDWGDVARWGAPLYQPPARLSTALRQEVDRIAREHTAPAERAAAALRLAQEQVRYLSVSMGTGSHAPRAPDQVYAQRFGDCKDKSLLTVTLMRALGLEAHVALVNTERRAMLSDVLPSAGVFDHAIVRAVVDGKTYWLDATRAPQRARLDAIAPADFSRALVLSPDTTELASMDVGPAAQHRRQINVLFDLSQGPGHRAGFEVTTRYEGRAAEDMRNGNFSEDLTRYGNDALKYYAGFKRLAGIRSTAPMEWDDDEAANVVTTRERYDYDDPWERDKGGRPTMAGLPSPEMHDVLRKPDVTMRKQPLSLARREELLMLVEERVPSDWTPLAKESEEKRFDTPTFSYRREYRAEGHRVFLTQRYAAKADHVPVKELASHAKKMDDAGDWVGHDLYWSQGQGTVESANWGRFLSGVAGALAIWLLVRWAGPRIARRRLSVPPPTPPAHQSPDAPSSPDRH